MLEKTFQSLGTLNHIRIFDSDDERILYKAQARVAEINDRMSAFKSDSDIGRLNANSGKSPVAVSQDTFRVLEQAVDFSEVSHGAFDCTVRPLVELWGIGKKLNFIPTAAEVAKAKSKIGYKDIVLDPKKSTALLRHHGQAMDLGGIAKGFAADETRRVLIENGVKSAIINLGGNIIALGKRPDGQSWRIGIQNPVKQTGRHIAVLCLEDKTIVTSASNERFFIKDGVRYHHLIDPRTGYPADTSLLSVTIVCENSMHADALSTALFVMGKSQCEPLLSAYRALAVFIEEDLTCSFSNKLRKNENEEIVVL